MASSQGNPGFSYMPQPFEQAYYLGLFNAADTERSGTIGGAQAVQFFSRSKLPVDVLKAVWTVSDNPPTNTLDHRKFAVAVRLIQLAQNGQKGQGPNLAALDGVVLRPVFFDGISGVSVPSPQETPPSQPDANPKMAPRSEPELRPQPSQPQVPPMVQHQNPHLQQNSTPAGHQQSSGSDEMSTSHNPRFHPNTPPRPPHPNYGPMSGALTVQDPYTMTPTEQARYEHLFVDYAKEDGYCYGSEAVTLFGKSGLPQQQLAAIWNMVDIPVDNRLDKLEFALAMHLIVCVSKKNLPLPIALPLPLKQLKSQQPHPPPATISSPSLDSQQAPMTGALHEPPPISTIPSPTLSSQPPPMMRSMNNTAGFGYDHVGQTPSVNGMEGFGTTQMRATGFVSGVPTESGSVGSKAGGMGISGFSGQPPLQPSIGGASISDAFEGLITGGAETESISTYRAASPQIQTTTSFDTTNSDFQSTKFSINQDATAHAPITSPAPASLQKTRASAPYDDSGSGTEELRAALQKLQAENISLKAKLSTMVGEDDDVRRELKKTVAEISNLSNELTTLRAQVLAAKSRLLEATGELTAAKEKKSVIKDLITETKATKIAIEEATKSVEEANAASVATKTVAASFEGDLFDWGSGDVVLPPVAAPATSSIPVNQQVASIAPAPAIGHGYSTSSGSYDMGTTSNSFGLSEPTARVNLNDIPPNGHPAPQSFAMPSFNVTENPKKADLIREPSIGFSGVMGGAADFRGFSSGSNDIPAEEDYGDVEELKKKAKAAKDALREAENVALDAQESKAQVLAHANELRRLYDEAERLAREAAAPATGKKKGMFARGQKHDPKAAAKLAADARDKKDAFLEAQSQANDASALANETKKEVERLRKEAEDLELKAASAASMQKPVSAPAPSVANGFATQPFSYGFAGGGPSITTAYGGNEPYDNGAFNANVMGSGGVSIPTPVAAATTANDPYGNPF